MKGAGFNTLLGKIATVLLLLLNINKNISSIFVAKFKNVLFFKFLKHSIFLNIQNQICSTTARKPKTDYNSCCQKIVQGALWLAKHYLSTISVFLTQFCYFPISSSYPIVLTRQGELRSRPCISMKFSRVFPGPLRW